MGKNEESEEAKMAASSRRFEKSEESEDFKIKDRVKDPEAHTGNLWWIRFLWNVAKINKDVKQKYLYLANKSIRIEIRWEMKEETWFLWNVAKINKDVNNLFTKQILINKAISFVPSTYI